MWNSLVSDRNIAISIIPPELMLWIYTLFDKISRVNVLAHYQLWPVEYFLGESFHITDSHCSDC